MVASTKLITLFVLFGAVVGEQRKLRSAAPSSWRIVGNVSAKAILRKGAKSFEDWYDSHTTGRGIWKWNNALVAYQRHFSCYIGKPVKFAEVGVQSGGSIEMWQDVLGDKCTVYGLDINPATKAFKDDKTLITIGDQGDPKMWKEFYSKTTSDLDILVDDGGHESHQMLTTLAETFPKINKGGFVSIEDIHGPDAYIWQFFNPTAEYLAGEAKNGILDSVHVYPYLLIVQKADGPESHSLKYSGKEVKVSNTQQIWDSIWSREHRGHHVVLRNPSWGSFFTATNLKWFFQQFRNIHYYSMHDVPPGCAHTSAAVCTNYIVEETSVQNYVVGFHVYADRLVVETSPTGTEDIHAVRRGDAFMGYGL